MPDRRSIVKNHALNRDRGCREAAGAGAASWGGGAAPHPPRAVPSGALASRCFGGIRLSVCGQGLTGSLPSAGKGGGVKTLPGRWETCPEKGSKSWKGGPRIHCPCYIRGTDGCRHTHSVTPNISDRGTTKTRSNLCPNLPRTTTHNDPGAWAFPCVNLV